MSTVNTVTVEQPITVKLESDSVSYDHEKRIVRCDVCHSTYYTNLKGPVVDFLWAVKRYAAAHITCSSK